MNDDQNTCIVRQLFDYYSQSDMPGFMSLLSPDIIWIEPGGVEIPYAGTFRGTAEIGKMLEIIATSLRMISFKVNSFCAGDNIVTALGCNEAEVKSTGKQYKTDWVYAFSFTDSKISSVQVYMDTQTIANAYFVEKVTL